MALLAAVLFLEGQLQIGGKIAEVQSEAENNDIYSIHTIHQTSN